MLPLPLFQHHAPRSVDEAVALLEPLGLLVSGEMDLVDDLVAGFKLGIKEGQPWT